jgi:hypothetical protein
MRLELSMTRLTATSGLEVRVTAMGRKFLIFCIKMELREERHRLKGCLLKLLLVMAGKILILPIRKCEESTLIENKINLINILRNV